MIYRFSAHKIPYDELITRMEQGEHLDSDALYLTSQKEKSDRKELKPIKGPLKIFIHDSKPIHFRTQEERKIEEANERREIIYAVFGGLTAGATIAAHAVVSGASKIVAKTVNKATELVEKKRNNKIDIITVSGSEVMFFADDIKAKVAELVKKGHRVNVVVDGCAESEIVRPDQRIEYNFNTLMLAKLWDLNHDLQQLGMKDSIKFNEYFLTTKYSDLKTCWDLEQVINANNEIDSVVRRIQDLKLSPYETMVYIHKYLTQNYGYGHNNAKSGTKDDDRNDENNRSIIAAIKNKQTICAGFASMTKAIVDRLNMPGLKCDYISADVYKNEESIGGHALSLITIEDQKYEISGQYLNDATWDCKNEQFPQGQGFGHFMYPVSDIDKFRIGLLKPVKGSRSRVYIEEKLDRDIMEENKDIPPIPFEKFKKAVHTVYTLERDFCGTGSRDEAIFHDLEWSMVRAYTSRIVGSGTINPLVKNAEELFTITPIDPEKENTNYNFYINSDSQLESALMF